MTVPAPRSTAHTVGYVGGLGRSGSTLLEQIAAGLPGVCVLGEVLYLWERGVHDDERCSCGERFSRCPFWQEVGARAFGGWRRTDADEVRRLQTAVDRMRHVPALGWGRASTRLASEALAYGAWFAEVYAAAAAVAGASVVIDSSKHASTAFVLRRVRRPAALDLRVVHLIRDSRGVAYSWTKVVRRPEADSDSPNAVMYRYPPWRAALLWNAQNAGFAALARTTTPVWRLRYEELLVSPVRTAHRLADFLGVPGGTVEDFVTPTCVSVVPTHQISGNPVRFSSGAVQLRRDDAWRDALPATDRRLVTALTAPLMSHYGYFASHQGRDASDE